MTRQTAFQSLLCVYQHRPWYCSHFLAQTLDTPTDDFVSLMHLAGMGSLPEPSAFYQIEANVTDLEI